MNNICVINALDLVTLLMLCTRKNQEVNKTMMESLVSVMLGLRNKSQNTITSPHFSQKKNSEK